MNINEQSYLIYEIKIKIHYKQFCLKINFLLNNKLFYRLRIYLLLIIEYLKCFIIIVYYF